MDLIGRWKNHLKENNMTYCKHLMFAVGHGITCLNAGLYLIIHGLFPCFYERVGSELVHKLEKVFTERESFLSDCKKDLR
jgi:hypothetical protein